MLWELYSAFFRIALFSIGGGYAAMPVIASEMVERRGILTLAEYADLVTLAEMTPGPIQLNAATFAGMRAAGWMGAVCATLGAVTPSLIIVTLLAWLYTRYHSLRILQNVLGFLRPAVVALIATAACKLVLLVGFGEGRLSLEAIKPFGLVLFGVALFLLRKLKCSPIGVIALCGVISLCVGMMGF